MLKVLVHPKMKILALILTLTLQTRKTFVHLQNTHKKIFLVKSESFLTCIDRNAADTLKAQKDSKDIVKIVHVTSVVQP